MKHGFLVYSIALALLVLPAAAQRGGRGSHGGGFGSSGMRSGRVALPPDIPPAVQRGPAAEPTEPGAARSGQSTPKVRTREEVIRRERTDPAAKSRQDGNAQQRQMQNRTRREATGVQPGASQGVNRNQSMQREKARSQSGERP
jgi:hypothetical protein